MGVLTQTSRHQLLVLLAAMPGIDTRAGRDQLLRDLPLSVVQNIPRPDATVADLEAIVYAADSWWPPDGPVADYPLRLVVTAAIDLAVGSQTAIALEAFLATLPATLDSSARPRCPYPGMVSFSPEDARFFYGREPEIAEMLRRLRVGRYLLVIGPSGSGKSSLATAGLLPALARQQPGTWHSVTLRLGAAPAAALAQALGGDPAQPGAAVAALLAAQAPATRLLVIVDQFEELFTQADQAAQSTFLTALTALRAVPAVTLVLLMRADFYPDLMQSALWPPGEGERLEIAPLHGDALPAAITRPAADVGVEVEPELVERLVGDAADEPGSLPLLQEALVLLWEQVRGRALQLADYAVLGRDGRSGLAVALATRADVTYNSLTSPQQGVARRIFLRLLAFGEGRPDTRRQQAVAALQVPGEDRALFAGTLAVLTDHRLLTTSGKGQVAGARHVDIAHEVLIRSWPLLQSWITERHTAEQTRRRLEDQAADWVRLGQGAGGVLDAAELPEAERWLTSPDASDLGASADLRALVAASHEALAAVRRAQIAANQRLRAIAAGLAVALLLAVAGGGLAFLQTQAAVSAQTTAQERATAAVAAQRTAQDRATVAVAAQATAQVLGQINRAQALAGQAVAQEERDPELSLLLAMQAISRTQAIPAPVGPQEEDALHRALLSSAIRVVLRGHTLAVTSAAFSPVEQRIVTAGADGTARLWDAATGQELRILRGHTQAVTSAAFSPNGQQIVTGSWDSTARVWDTVSGRPVLTLTGHTGPVTSVAFSPDGRRIATASTDRTAQLWDAKSGQKGLALTGHTGPVTSVAFSPDGHQLVTASEDTTARVWSVITAAPRAILTDPPALLTSAAFSPDGQEVVTARDDGTAQVWDVPTAHVRTTLRGHSARVTSAAFSPDGQQIVTASWDSTAQLWDATTGQGLRTFRGVITNVNSVTFSPDGRRIVTANADGTAKIWDAGPGQEAPTLEGHTDEVTSAAFSPDNKLIVTASVDKTARVWDSISGQAVLTFTGHTDKVIGAAFSPDGKQIVTASFDTTAQLWDPTSGKVVRTFPDPAADPPDGHTDWVISAAFSPDGQHIVTASADHTARVWNVGTGQREQILQGHEARVNSAAFSPDGKQIVTASWDRTAQIWNVATGVRELLLPSSTDWINSAAFSPDGRWVVTASWDRSAQLWDARTAQVVRIFTGHSDRLTSAAFSPDGQLLVTTSSDKTVRLWEVASGQERATLRGYTATVWNARFSPDGHRVVTASADHTARQYLVDIDDLMALAQTRVTRALTPDERARYLGEPLPTPTPLPPSPAVSPTTIP